MSVETILIGLAIGFLVGLTGVGGGVILAPVLLYIGIQPTIAVGTDLVYSSVTKLFGWLQHWRQGNVCSGWVVYTALGSVPASFAGTYAIHLLGVRYGTADPFLTTALGVVLMLAAAAIMVRELIRRPQAEPGPGYAGIGVSPFLAAGLGAVIGFVVGLTSVGSGSLFALVLLVFSRMGVRHVVGTDVAHGAILVTAAALAHTFIGTVDFALAGNLLAGSVPGVILGSRATSLVPARPLKVGLALLILLGGVRLI